MVKDNKKNEFKTITKRTMLLLNREENYDVEFKESLKGLDSSDIVAFANSELGGSILVGVKEIKIVNGRSRGEVVGCRVGDGEKQSILNKAESCVPPVDVEIFIENSRHNPFFRIEIPSSSKKPHCTSGGTYKIRGDGRVKALLPGSLLTMFIETETQKFIEKFRDATRELGESITGIKYKVMEEMNELLDHISSMEDNVEAKLKEIFYTAENAESLSDEAMTYSDETLGEIHELEGKVLDLESKIDALLKKFGIEDPTNIYRTREMVKAMVERFSKGKDAMNKKELLKFLQGLFPNINEKQLKSWYKEKIDELKTK